MVAMQIKAMAHFYRYQAQTRLRRHVWDVRHNITGECAILKYSGTAFFAGAHAAYKKSGTIFLLGIPAFDIVSYVTAMTLFSCATHVTYVQHAHCTGHRFEIEAIRPLLGSAVIYSISAVTQSPYNSFRHILILI